MRAQFITFEGIEGLGKTTNIAWLESCLKSKGIRVIRTREPGGTPVAEALRSILLNPSREPLLAQTELLLLYAGRLQHMAEVIKPALAKGIWVLCDRFSDATFAYHGGGRDIPLAQIETIHEWALGDFKPDHTILLDAPVSLSMQRLVGKARDRIESEKEAFFERVRLMYRQLAEKEPNRFCVIDAQLSLELIQELIVKQLEKWLIQ